MKTDFTQSVEAAMPQHRTDRKPKSAKTGRIEPLLAFRRGAVAHFARNVLAHTPSRHKAAMTEGLKRLFRAETASEARKEVYALMDEMEDKSPRAVA